MKSVHDFVDTRHRGRFYDLVSYHTIVRNGRWFDGTGAPSAVINIAIPDVHILRVTHDYRNVNTGPQIYDERGNWDLRGLQE